MSMYMNFEVCEYNESEKSYTLQASEDFMKGREDGLALALLTEDFLDFNIYGDDECLSNFDMASLLFNWYYDLLFIIPYSVSDKFMKGEVITVYGREITDEERAEFEERMG